MSNIEEYEQYYLYNKKLENNILKKHGLDDVRLHRTSQMAQKVEKMVEWM